MKNKFFMIIAACTSFLRPAFEVQMLDSNNIEQVKLKQPDSVDMHCVLDIGLQNTNGSILVCFSKETKEVCGFLRGYFVDHDATIDSLIWIFDNRLETEIKTALIHAFERRCKLLGIKRIYINYNADDLLSQELYTQLGYTRFSAVKRAVLSALRATFKCFMFDGPAEGTFKKQIELYKTL